MAESDKAGRNASPLHLLSDGVNKVTEGALGRSLRPFLCWWG